jgi:hypothetical protein
VRQFGIRHRRQMPRFRDAGDARYRVSAFAAKSILTPPALHRAQRQFASGGEGATAEDRRFFAGEVGPVVVDNRPSLTK